jgi:putative ABC transport system substrate-binding protein
MAAELVRLNVDVIVASGSQEVIKQVTTTIPIVFVPSADPVGEGLVQSLARPGGNLTGLSDLHGHLVSKRLELVKETVPSAGRIAFLWNSATSPGALQLKELQAAAPAVGVILVSYGVKQPDDFNDAFADMAKKRLAAVIVHGNPLISNQRKQIFEFMLKNRLPAIYSHEQWVGAGGLMSYGAYFPELFRRAAVYVDKILKGTKPADLPVEQPTKFEFVINLKTAKQIGLTIPPNVLARADRVIR